jgi:hypothetical protein
VERAASVREGASKRRATPIPRGSRPSTAALTRLGARKANDIVMLTWRVLQASRAAAASGRKWWWSSRRASALRLSRGPLPLALGCPATRQGSPWVRFLSTTFNPLPPALPRPGFRAITSSKNTPFSIKGRARCASTRSRARRDGRSRTQVAERHAPRRMYRRCRGSPACAASPSRRPDR